MRPLIEVAHKESRVYGKFTGKPRAPSITTRETLGLKWYYHDNVYGVWTEVENKSDAVLRVLLDAGWWALLTKYPILRFIERPANWIIDAFSTRTRQIDP